MQLEELLRRCEQELAAGVALHQACLRQQQAMVEGGAGGVGAATAATVSALAGWREAAHARQAATAAMGAPDLGALAGSLPEAEATQVRRQRNDLLASWAEIQRLNRQNDVLARHSLAVIDLALQRVVGGHAPTYGPKGRQDLAARVLSTGG